MKNILVSSVVITTMVGSAIAADLPSIKSAPVASPAQTWTGFYAGLNAGGIWGMNNGIQVIETPTFVQHNIASAYLSSTTNALLSTVNIPIASNVNFIAGAQMGYNEIIQNKYLFGVETDFQGTTGRNNNGSIFQHYNYSYYQSSTGSMNTFNVYNIYSVSKSLEYLGTARARLGFLVHPAISFYATAGMAYGQTNFGVNGQGLALVSTADVTPVSNHSFSHTRVGWSAGAGAEWMFSGNWSAKAEYVYYDLGRQSLYMGQAIRIWNGSTPSSLISKGGIVSIQNLNSSTHFIGNIVRAGVNYHFNIANVAPVVAKF